MFSIRAKVFGSIALLATLGIASTAWYGFTQKNVSHADAIPTSGSITLNYTSAEALKGNDANTAQYDGVSFDGTDPIRHAEDAPDSSAAPDESNIDNGSAPTVAPAPEVGEAKPVTKDELVAPTPAENPKELTPEDSTPAKTSASVPSPVLSFVAPAAAKFGETIMLRGTGFIGGTSYLSIDKSGTSSSASTTDGRTLIFQVPSSLGTCPDRVICKVSPPVTVGLHKLGLDGGSSSLLDFTVLDASASAPKVNIAANSSYISPIIPIDTVHKLEQFTVFAPVGTSYELSTDKKNFTDWITPDKVSDRRDQNYEQCKLGQTCPDYQPGPVLSSSLLADLHGATAMKIRISAGKDAASFKGFTVTLAGLNGGTVETTGTSSPVLSTTKTPVSPAINGEPSLAPTSSESPVHTADIPDAPSAVDGPVQQVPAVTSAPEVGQANQPVSSTTKTPVSPAINGEPSLGPTSSESPVHTADILDAPSVAPTVLGTVSTALEEAFHVVSTVFSNIFDSFWGGPGKEPQSTPDQPIQPVVSTTGGPTEVLSPGTGGPDLAPTNQTTTGVSNPGTGGGDPVPTPGTPEVAVDPVTTTTEVNPSESIVTEGHGSLGSGQGAQVHTADVPSDTTVIGTVSHQVDTIIQLISDTFSNFFGGNTSHTIDTEPPIGVQSNPEVASPPVDLLPDCPVPHASGAVICPAGETALSISATNQSTDSVSSAGDQTTETGSSHTPLLPLSAPNGSSATSEGTGSEASTTTSNPGLRSWIVNGTSFETTAAPTLPTNSSNQMKLDGHTVANGTVTITVRSTPQTYTVTADANGDWSFTVPVTGLEASTHTVEIASSDTGSPTTLSFQVAEPELATTSGAPATVLASTTVPAATAPKGITVPAASFSAQTTEAIPKATTVAVSASIPAPAATSNAVAATSLKTNPGGTVSVSAKDLTSKTVATALTAPGKKPVPLAEAKITNDTVKMTSQIPASVAPGDYALTLTGKENGEQVSVPVTVAVQSATSTKAKSSWWLAIVAILVFVGIVVVWRFRHRQAAVDPTWGQNNSAQQ